MPVEIDVTTVYIEDRPYPMDPEQNLLHQCLSAGFNLPYFCWHPALGSVGACRQCAVKQFKDEHDKHGRIVMACMTPASDGTRISIKDSEAAAFRAGIIEGMMLNHPHDCPVCDEGGECHLQDMTVMTGHDYRRYRFEKRTFLNQYLGPFLNHEMNRCIQCYRCVRFYREYAGGADFNSFALRNLVYFGRDKDGVLENEFAGNLVEVCPTGVFTDATLKRHYTRKWDLEFSPSICTQCSLGCNISIGKRYDTLRRVVNRYNGEVNGYFLCDRGRFGYEFVNSERRIRQSRLRTEAIGPDAAKRYLRDLVASNPGVIGIGSPRASLESNFALRALVGPDRFYAGIPSSELELLRLMLDILRSGPARTPSLREVESSDAVLVLGEDVMNVAPRMALSLRQSVRQQPIEIAKRLHVALWQDHGVREVLQDAKGPFFIATSSATRLDDIATECCRGAPDDVARVGYAIARALHSSSPEPQDLADNQRAFVESVTNAFKMAKRPLVISGASYRNIGIIRAAANVSRVLPGAKLSFITPECNSFGLAFLTGASLEAAIKAKPTAAIVIENDLYRRLPAPEVDAFFSQCAHVVVLDHLENRTTTRAELVLSTATFAEADGTLVNNECRAQRFFGVFPPSETIRQSWQWLGEWENLDRVIADMSEDVPGLSAIAQAAPSAAFRMSGAKVPREPHRWSGRTAVLANITVDEPKPPVDLNSPLSFSMEGNPDQPPAALIPFFWSPGWNSVQATNKFQEEIAGPLRGGDPGVKLIEAWQGEGIPMAPRAAESDEDARLSAPNRDRQGADAFNGAFFASVPSAFQPREDVWLIIPLFHIFGSDELSRAAPAVAQLFPDPYLALNADDAAKFGAKASVMGRNLPVRVTPGLPQGVAGLPSGLPSLEGIMLPAWSGISRI
jgi:NADH-quinone oxidoreductase subunit G